MVLVSKRAVEGTTRVLAHMYYAHLEVREVLDKCLCLEFGAKQLAKIAIERGWDGVGSCSCGVVLNAI